MTSRVVYTALFGEHEALLEQEVAGESSLRFLCFTDNPALASTSWEIIHVEPLFAGDPRRSQRDIKIRGHNLLAEYDQWLYLDNTVRLKVSPEEILDQWLVDADWAAIEHEAHSSTWQEFDANLSMNKDTAERLNEQLQDYSSHHGASLDEHPLWNGLFARRNTPDVRAFAELWFHHVCRYSARDQLSIMVALGQRPIRVRRLHERVRNSRWHDWPHRQNETPKSKALRHAKTSGLKPLAEELHDARGSIGALEAEINALRDARLFGVAGLWRRLQEARRAKRRAKKQAKKRGQ
jgi:hypothetical protein